MHIHIIVILVSFFNLFSCSQSKENVQNTNKPIEKTTSNSETADYEIEVFVTGLEVPWSIVFTSPTRVLVTERPGRIRVIENGKVIEQPLKTINDVVSDGEEGLMGLALDPDYANNKFIYVSYAYESGSDMKVKVVRFTDNGSSLTGDKVIIDNIPAERYHAGCRLRFGPDNKLYITTGDAGERELSQETGNLYGKILRLNSDGSVPPDNPFNNAVWSYGHRNAQGIDWYPGTDILYETEHGPSGFDGGTGGDEVNVVVKGGNYGWPIVSHNESKSGMLSPVIMYPSAVAPASGMFYKSGVIPQFKNNFFFGCLRGRALMRVVVDESNPSKVISHEKLAGVDFGRIRDVAEGPDGFIYFSSSNLDGRGNPEQGDDKIYRIVKK